MTNGPPSFGAFAPPTLPDRPTPTLPDRPTPSLPATTHSARAALPVVLPPTNTPPQRSAGRIRGWLLTLLIVAGACVAGYWFMFRENGSTSTDVTVASLVDALTPPAAGQQPVRPTELLGAPYLGPLTFQWQPNCVVPVREVVTKDGSTAELAYGLSIVGEGENLVVSFTDMTILTMNGLPVPAEIVDKTTAGFLLPSFVVGPNGTVVEVRGMAEIIAAATAALPDSAAVYTPAVIAGIESTVVAKYWDSWVGRWASLGSIDQPRLEATGSSTSSGTSFDTAIVVESLGVGAGGQAHLREVQTLEGENFLSALGAAIPSISSDPTAAGRRITTVDLATDPLTLRPTSVGITIDIQLTANGETESQLESRHSTMDWAGAGCS